MSDALQAAGVLFLTPSGKALWMRQAGGGEFEPEWVFPGGKIEPGETAAQAAAREANEETGALPASGLLRLHRATTERGVDYTTFLQVVPGEFQPALSAEHSAYAWAPVSDPPKPTHPGILAMLAQLFDAPDAKAVDEASLAANAALPVGAKKKADDEAPAQDALALDRRMDDDGRLHVLTSPITQACVSEYWGREIPNWQSHGLTPDRKYKLLRAPEELSRPETIASLNNLPLLDQHVPISAEAHQPEHVIGSTGTDAAWNDPWLSNSLVIWKKNAIDQAESGVKSALSAGYRYTYDPTPGTWNGEDFDGCMRNIIFNHLAQVVEPRVPGAMIGDAAITEESTKPKGGFWLLTAKETNL